MNNNNNPENRIQYYIQYLSSWFYHNVLYTETAAVLLKIIVFVVLLSLLVYQKYYYFVAGAAGAALASVYLFLRPGAAAEGAEWPGMMDNAVRRVDKDELTIGVPLVKEGFSIAMPKIIKGDDSGKDYRRSNKFIEEDSRDFTEKYFNSKKCGIGSGIGGITMFGSNELIGGSRTAELSGLYNFEAYYVENDSTGNSATRYKYFKDCVFEPVKRSIDPLAKTDFRNTKTTIYNNVNDKIIHINKTLDRFNMNILFDTQTNPSADYSQRISLSNRDNSDTELRAPSNTGVAYTSLITGENNRKKLENIQLLSKSDNITDKMYAELLTTTNNDKNMSSNERQRQLDVYAKVYEIRKKLDSIFANMRAQTKDDASLLYTVRISESVVQELRMMLSYLAIIQRTNDVIQFEKNAGTADKNGIYNMAPTGLPPTGELGVITKSDNKLSISGVNNIFKIPTDDDTYNNNDEKRYVYGITYYFDKSNSKPTGAV